MENAGVERLQTRITEASLPEATTIRISFTRKYTTSKNTKLISSIDGQPTQEKLGLPLPFLSTNYERNDG